MHCAADRVSYQDVERLRTVAKERENPPLALPTAVRCSPTQCRRRAGRAVAQVGWRGARSAERAGGRRRGRGDASWHHRRNVRTLHSQRLLRTAPHHRSRAPSRCTATARREGWLSTARLYSWRRAAMADRMAQPLTRYACAAAWSSTRATRSRNVSPTLLIFPIAHARTRARARAQLLPP